MRFSIFLVILAAAIFTFNGCDRIDHIYEQTGSTTNLDTTLYDGNWNDYLENEWPDFNTITASNLRNVLIEDFTGHNCTNCPAAATIAHNIHEANPERVFVASIHSGPLGMSTFQQVSAQYNVDFTNSNSLELGTFFGSIPSSGFGGNPSGTASRVKTGSAMFYSAGNWNARATEVMASALRVKIKSKLNYFPSTKGAFLHTEVEVIDNSLTTELALVAYLLQDTMVAPQLVSGTFTPDYVHRDSHLKTIGGLTFGKTLDASVLNENGKYYVDYSFVVPNQLAPVGQTGTHDATNMHVLIYVYDKTTYEIYQVVKEKFVN